MTLAEQLNLVWPLAFVLVALFVIRKVESDFRPIVVGIVTGLATNAQQRALFYAMAFMYASAASLQALGEVATQFEWVYVAAFAKVASPGIVAIIAYVTKPPSMTQPIDPPKNPPSP